MRIVVFCHSLVSDWNHGNAHFLRGVCSELIARGNSVAVYEPRDSWSLANLVADRGEGAIAGFHRAYPTLASERYTLATLDLERALDGADLVLVHEWSDHDLVRRIGEHRLRAGGGAKGRGNGKYGGGYRLLFHDTHHRAVTDPGAMAAYDLRHYDGVLAFGKVIADLYLERGWAGRAWVWHEAADPRVFRPLPSSAEDRRERGGDLVWIGNWGDDERTAELGEFLLDPVRDLALRARVHGVRYPETARAALAAAGIDYGGFLPNHEAPRAYSRFSVTVHVPRRPYVAALPGIPTIRVFEALACGIPLVSAPWEDAEGLFAAGEDFLFARDGAEMRRRLSDVLNDRDFAAALARRGRETVLARHTCAHRVDQLLDICDELAGRPAALGLHGDPGRIAEANRRQAAGAA